jgi:hypothetical protein
MLVGLFSTYCRKAFPAWSITEYSQESTQVKRQLIKLQVVKMASHQNGKLSKWQVVKMASCQNGKSSKCQVIKMPSHQNGMSSKWQFIKTAILQNSISSNLHKLVQFTE